MGSAFPGIRTSSLVVRNLNRLHDNPILAIPRRKPRTHTRLAVRAEYRALILVTWSLLGPRRVSSRVHIAGVGAIAVGVGVGTVFRPAPPVVNSAVENRRIDGYCCGQELGARPRGPVRLDGGVQGVDGEADHGDCDDEETEGAERVQS